MLPLFHPAPHQPGTGSPATLDDLQRGFVQDSSSGLVELRPGDGSQVVFLYEGGKPFGVFRLDEKSSTEISPGELTQYWTGADAPMRSLKLSSQAVRLAWQALEWYPAAESYQIKNADLSSEGSDNLVIEKYRSGQTDGLLQLSTPDMDGFITLMSGRPVLAETLFASPTGMEEGLGRIRQLARARLNEQARATFFIARTETCSYEIFCLRQAVNHWVQAVLMRYQKVVGDNLLNTLTFEVNTSLRLKKFNLRLVGNTLVDNHLSRETGLARQIYRDTIGSIAAQMKRILGAELTERTLAGAYSRLAEREQAWLAQHALLQRD